jgi:GNAT superfamily N-acetyltransferase
VLVGLRQRTVLYGVCPAASSLVCLCVGVKLLPQVLECAVDPAYQSKGIGTALLQHMLETDRWAGLLLAVGQTKTGTGTAAACMEHTACGWYWLCPCSLCCLPAPVQHDWPTCVGKNAHHSPLTSCPGSHGHNC